MSSYLPPQAYIFRTSRMRLLEIILVLSLGLLWAFHDAPRAFYHLALALAPSLSVLPFQKKNRQTVFFSVLPCGILFSLLIPTGAPWWLSLIGAIFLGQLKVLRPRLPVFPLVLGLLILSWPAHFLPAEAPLVKAFSQADGSRALDSITASGIQPTTEDAALTDRINNLLAPAGVNLPAGYGDLFFGRGSATLADMGWPFLLVGLLYLLARGHLNWQGPFGFLLVFLPGVLLFGGLVMGKSVGDGDALFLFLSGSFMLPLFYGLAEYSLMPLGAGPRFLAGLFAGLLAFLGASFYPPAVPYGTLLAVWLAQRTFERTRVKEVYHHGDSMLLLWNGGR